MKNKTWKYLVVVSVALVMAGCGSSAKKQSNDENSMDSVNVACILPISTATSCPTILRL